MQPLISVIIPHGPGGNIDYTLESLREVDYPKDRIEVLAAEGRCPSAQRNLAAKKAKGQYLFFYDDDVRVEKGEIKRILGHYKEGVACVGGPNLTPQEDVGLQQAFGYAMSSFFGAAKMSVRYKAAGEVREAGETDLILCNLSADRKIFLEMGGFPNEFYPNEENVFFNRVREKGHKLLYDPEAIVYHKRRANLWKTMKQIFSYGRGRFQQTSVQPKSFRPMFMAPSILVLYLASLLVYRPLVYLNVLLLYLFLDFCFSMWVSVRNRDYFHFFTLLWMFPLIHISYGCGFLYGLFRFIGRRKYSRDKEIKNIKIRKVEL